MKIILYFWFIDIWNNIDQLQRSGSCIRMSEGWIWVGKIRPRITHTHTYIERETCVLSKRFEPESFQLKYNPRHSNTRSTPLELIYIILSIYKPKIMCFEYFLSIHQAAQNGPKVVSWLDLYRHTNSRSGYLIMI